MVGTAVNGPGGKSPVAVLGPWRVSVVVGDLAHQTEHFDALVSSDDNYLSHGGGVSAALWAAAGPALEQETATLRQLRIGDLHETSAGRLNAGVLLHAVTIDLDTMASARLDQLVLLYGRILDLGLERGWKRIALPVLGTGVAGVEAETALTALADAIDARKWELSPPSLTVVAFHEVHADAAVRTLANRPAGSQSLDEVLDAARNVLTSELLERLRAALTALSPDAEAPAHDAPVQFLETALEALALAGGVRPTSMEYRPLGELLEQAIEGYRAAGVPLDPALVALCARGIDARNRFVRRPWAAILDEPSQRRDQINAAAGILQFLAGDHPEPSPATSTRSGGSADGTSHVRNLHQLLRAELSPSRLDSLLTWLLENDYAGEPDMRLLDYCVNESPVDILLKVFSGDDLDRLLADRVHTAERGADAQALAQRLAEALGYPPQPHPHGIVAVKRQIQRARADCGITSEHELTGAVARCSSALETLLRTYLGFLCHAAFGQPAQRWAHNAGHLRPQETIAKASLGTLIRLITEFQDDIETGVAPRAGEFRRDFGTVHLLPAGLEKTLASPRNTLVHGGAGTDETMTRAQIVRKAREFYDQAERLLSFLNEPSNPLYPRVVVISRIETDDWGRRIATATGEDGERHRIFTDQVLEPAQTYLMRPLTNPIRVDPILLPVQLS